MKPIAPKKVGNAMSKAKPEMKGMDYYGPKNPRPSAKPVKPSKGKTSPKTIPANKKQPTMEQVQKSVRKTMGY